MLKTMFNPDLSGKKKKTWRGILLLAIGMALIVWLPKQAMADYYIAWTDTIDNGDDDYARGVAIDGFNNIIVTGYFKIGENYDIYTVKYDPNGNILWADTIDAGNPGLAHICCSVATDASDNIIVTGVSNDSYYFTVKYEPDSNILWTDINTGSGGYMYMCCGVTTDGADNIIVTRGLYYPTYSDYCVVKHDPDGNVLWTDTIDIGTWDYACGITTDGADNIIVTGYSLIGGSWHDCTVKYDADGNRLWTNIGSGEEAYGVATDSADNIIVTGYARPGGQNDYYTVKYDPDGNVLWTDTIGIGLYDLAKGVATDSADNIFVTGTVVNPTGNYDYYTVKYEPNGNVLWTASVDNGFHDQAYGVATDDADNVIVTGCSKIGWNYDYYTVKYVPVINVGHQTLLKQFALYPNNPNPFSTRTLIQYNLPKDSHINIQVYNVKGQLVETLVNDFQQAGYYSVTWYAKDSSTGIYLYRITAGDFTDTKKCVILK